MRGPPNSTTAQPSGRSPPRSAVARCGRGEQRLRSRKHVLLRRDRRFACPARCPRPLSTCRNAVTRRRRAPAPQGSARLGGIRSQQSVLSFGSVLALLPPIQTGSAGRLARRRAWIAGDARVPCMCRSRAPSTGVCVGRGGSPRYRCVGRGRDAAVPVYVSGRGRTPALPGSWRHTAPQSPLRCRPAGSIGTPGATRGPSSHISPNSRHLRRRRAFSSRSGTSTGSASRRHSLRIGPRGASRGRDGTSGFARPTLRDHCGLVCRQTVVQ